MQEFVHHLGCMMYLRSQTMGYTSVSNGVGVLPSTVSVFGTKRPSCRMLWSRSGVFIAWIEQNSDRSEWQVNEIYAAKPCFVLHQCWFIWVWTHRWWNSNMSKPKLIETPYAVYFAAYNLWITEKNRRLDVSKGETVSTYMHMCVCVCVCFHIHYQIKHSMQNKHMRTWYCKTPLRIVGHMHKDG